MPDKKRKASERRTKMKTTITVNRVYGDKDFGELYREYIRAEVRKMVANGEINR